MLRLVLRNLVALLIVTRSFKLTQVHKFRKCGTAGTIMQGILDVAHGLLHADVLVMDSAVCNN